MNYICQHCNAKHFQHEFINNKKDSYNTCCSHGKVNLEPLPPLFNVLQQLFSGHHPKSKEFLNKIRIYNNSFSFASLNANLENLNAQRKGPFCYKIQRQIYHKINTALYPTLNEQASYGQLFILDSENATECRVKHNENLDDELLRILDQIIRENNIFAQSYQMLHEEISSEENSDDILNLKMSFVNKKTGIDKGRFNVTKVNEVAAIFTTTADGDIPKVYVTIKNKHDRTLQSVSTMDPNVEPWIYPLYVISGIN